MHHGLDDFLTSHGMEHTDGIMSREVFEDPYQLELSAKKVLKWLTGKSVVNPATQYVLHCIRIWPSNPDWIPLDEDDD